MNKTFTKILPCRLTDDEVIDRSDTLVQRLDALDKLKAEAAETAKRYKDQIAVVDDHCRKLRKAIEERSEDREVLCEERIDRARGVAQIYRLDTGEMVSERKLELDDLQEPLFGEGNVVAFDKKKRGR